jgi:hypothetical protein
MNDYSHLNVKVSKSFIKKVRLNYPLQKFPSIYIYFFLVIKFLSKINFVNKFANLIVNFSNSEKSLKKTKESIEKLKTENFDDANSLRSSFGYDEIDELKALINYAEQIKTNFPKPSESKLLYENINDIYSDILEKFDIKNFFNFGSLYSYVDYNLAKKFNNINFICSDRLSLTKSINENVFGDLNNIKFVDGDIFEYLKKTSLNKSLFFSTRTLVLLPKEFILKLYNQVYQSNFKYISLMEQVGISHETFNHFEFSENDKPSIAYRDGMYIHNYVGILKKSGYKILESKLIKTDHPHEDYRFVYILAERI